MATPQQYRHKPTTITALEYTTRNLGDLRAWLELELGYGRFEFQNMELRLETFEGDSRPILIDDGYRIAKGTVGEFYPIAAVPFAKSYVLVNGDDAYSYAKAALAEFRAADETNARARIGSLNYKAEAYVLQAALSRLLRSLEGDQS